MMVYLVGPNTTELKNYRHMMPSLCTETIETPLLFSFVYANDPIVREIIPKLKYFLLDSGAFTFFSSGKKLDWEEYVDRYADFINEFDVKYFFELDIDVLVGYEKVLELRKRLEEKTGKKCIPVWHKSRGKQEFLKMCDEYDYVSIGGIASKEIRRKEHKYFPWFIREAHKRGCKIHGLGFTDSAGLKKYKFDSVDSSSWSYGARYRVLYTFTGDNIHMTKKPNQRAVNSTLISIRNFNEWVKFQKYARKYL